MWRIVFKIKKKLKRTKMWKDINVYKYWWKTNGKLQKFIFQVMLGNQQSTISSLKKTKPLFHIVSSTLKVDLNVNAG